MKKLSALICALLLVLSACSGAPSAPEQADAAMYIVATTYPVYLFTTAITDGVEGVQVDLLVNQPTSCLHDYTLTVNDMKVIERAGIIVMNGAGLEDFMSSALAQTGAAVIDCSENISLLPARGHEGHDHDTEYDPHFWMSGEAALDMLDSISNGLSALDKPHAETYAQNFTAAASALSGSTLELTGLSCPYLITFHDGFQYFALDNGLTLLKSIEEEEGSEASAADIKEIVALIEEYGIPAIFTEKNGSDSTAQAIARETGCAVYQLDMLMSGDETGIQPYINAMAYNIDTIREALA